MLQSIKRRVSALRGYRRVRALWEEFARLAASGEDANSRAKLAEFLDNFTQLYRQYVEGLDAQTLDRIYGDCTDILLQLIDWVDRSEQAGARNALADLVGRALAVVELILRDDKYRAKVKQTPALVRQVVSLLDKVDGAEARRVLVRLVANLGGGDDGAPGSRSGQLDGVRKMLRLLVDGDDALRVQILRNVREFLHLHSLRAHDVAAAAAPPPAAAAAASAAATAAAAAVPAQSIRAKLSSVVVEFSKLALQVLPGAGGGEGGGGSGGVGDGGAGGGGVAPAAADLSKSPAPEAGASAQAAPDATASDAAEAFPPSREALSRACRRAAQELLARDRARRHREAARAASGASDTKGPEAAAASPSLVSGPADDAGDAGSQEILRELVRVQAQLRELSATVSEAALSVQVDLLDTIGSLLLRNPATQGEFSRLDGYSLILRLLDSVDSYSAPAAQWFLAACFDIITALALDGAQAGARLVGNLDCLSWLLHVVAHSLQPAVRLGALDSLQQLVEANPLNAAFIREVGGELALVGVLEQHARHPHLFVCHAKSQLDADQTLLVVQRTDALLRRLALVFARLDSSIFSEYLRLARRFPMPAAAMRSIVYASLAAMLAQCRALGVAPGERLARVFAELLDERVAAALAGGDSGAAARAVAAAESSAANGSLGLAPAAAAAAATVEIAAVRPSVGTQAPALDEEMTRQLVALIEALGHALVLEAPPPHTAATTSQHAVALRSSVETLARLVSPEWGESVAEAALGVAAALAAHDALRWGGLRRLVLPGFGSTLLGRRAAWRAASAAAAAAVAVAADSTPATAAATAGTGLASGDGRGGGDKDEKADDDDADAREPLVTLVSLLLAPHARSPPLRLRVIASLALLLRVDAALLHLAPDEMAALAARAALPLRDALPAHAALHCAGGTAALLETLRGAELEAEAEAALAALALATHGYEEAAALCSERCDLSDLALALRSRGLAVDTDMLALWLELATQRAVPLPPASVSMSPQLPSRAADGVAARALARALAPPVGLRESLLSAALAEALGELGQHPRLGALLGGASERISASLLRIARPLATSSAERSRQPQPAHAAAESSQPLARAAAEAGRRGPQTLFGFGVASQPLGGGEAGEEPPVFRDADAALSVLELLPRARDDAQRRLLQRLLAMLEDAACANLSALSRAGAIPLLLRALPTLPEAAQGLATQLLAALGQFDLELEHARLLLDLAFVSPSPPTQQPSPGDGEGKCESEEAARRRAAEMQMQLLYLIGRMCERRAPPHFFASSLRRGLALPPLPRQPPAKSGLSICFWLCVRLRGPAAPVSLSLLTLRGGGGGGGGDALVAEWACELSARDAAASVTDAEGRVTPLGRVAALCDGEWHAVCAVLARDAALLWVDGVAVGQAPCRYPLAKSAPLRARVAWSQAAAAGTAVRVGAVFVLEGALDEKQAVAFAQAGSLAEASPRECGIAHRVLLSLLPAERAAAQEAEAAAAAAAALRVVASTPSPRTTQQRSFSPSDSPLPVAAAASSLSPPPRAARRISEHSEAAATAATSGALPPLDGSGDVSEEAAPAAAAAAAVATATTAAAAAGVEEPAVVAHATRPLVGHLRALGGFAVSLPLLQLGAAQQVAGLRVLLALLTASRALAADFHRRRGFSAVAALLRGGGGGRGDGGGGELSLDAAEALFELVDGRARSVAPAERQLTHADGVTALLDVLLEGRVASGASAVAAIADAVTAPPPAGLTSATTWQTAGGMLALLQLLARDRSFVPHVVAMASHALAAPRTSDVELLVSWLASDERQLQGAAADKSLLLAALLRQCRRHRALLEQVARVGGLEFPLLLLRSPSEAVRVDALSLLAYLLHANSKLAAAFAGRIPGVDAVVMALAPQRPVTHLTCEALFKMAVGAPAAHLESEGGALASAAAATAAPAGAASKTRSDAECTRQALTQPQWLRVLLEVLMMNPGAHELHTHWLTQLQTLLAQPGNMEIFVTLKWVRWFRQYFTASTQRRRGSHSVSGSAHSTAAADDEPHVSSAADSDAERLAARVRAALPASASSASSYALLAPPVTEPSATEPSSDETPPASARGRPQRGGAGGAGGGARAAAAAFRSLLTRVVLADLARPPKQSHVLRVAKAVEAPAFQALVLESVVAHLLQHPQLDEATAGNVARNLETLLSGFEGVAGLRPAAVTRAVAAINLLASHNPASVRGKMKDAGLFVCRESLALHAVRGEMSAAERSEALRHFSFELVSHSGEFRESGLLYLLRFLHEPHSPQLQLVAADILRHQVAASEEYARPLAKLLEDAEVASRLVPQLPAADDAKRLDASEVSPPDAASTAAAAATAAPSAAGAPSPASPEASLDEFISWYFSEPLIRRRAAIYLRLRRALDPLEEAHARLRDRVRQKVRKLAVQREEKRLKAVTALARAVMDFMDRCASRQNKWAADLRDALRAAADARARRFEEGVALWAALRSEFGVAPFARLPLVCTSPGGPEGEAAASSTSAAPTPPPTLACSHCGAQLPSEWALVCHARLDHVESGSPT